MGTGKTTVGKLLAAQIGFKFIDTDELIVNRSGQTIPQIFAKLGEPAFRQMEAEITLELSNQEGLVISTGGRLMLDAENEKALSRNGQVFCLVATPEEILERIKKEKSHRPLLDVKNPAQRIAFLLRQREIAYGRFAQVSTTGKKPIKITEEIISLIQNTF